MFTFISVESYRYKFEDWFDIVIEAESKEEADKVISRYLKKDKLKQII